MNKVLFISYYFPPAGGSAVQRILKFVKYLPQFGWEPVVLTARERDYPILDVSLTREVPGSLRVERTAAPDLYSLYGRLAHKSASAAPDLSAIADRESAGGFRRLALAIRSSLFIPDARIGWIPFAYRAAVRLLKKEKIGLIFVSSPPFSGALLAGLLAKRFSIPWISDYRDPWTQAYFYFQRPGWARRLEEGMESRLLKQATRVIAINERILQGLREKYGTLEKERCRVIPNGYDPADFENLEPVKEPFFTVVYTGTLNTLMSPEKLLRAAKQLRTELPEFGRCSRFKFIGRVGSDLFSLFEDPGIHDMVVLHPHMEHGKSLQHALGADLLLLLIPQSSGSELIMTGKLFEYLRAGRTILCLSRKGDAADIVRLCRAGYTVEASDVGEIKRILLHEFVRWRKGLSAGRNAQNAEVQRFDRKKAAESLAVLFDEVAGRNPNSSLA